MLQNIRLRAGSEGSVYRSIYDWEPVESSHGEDIFYLLVHAQVQWGKEHTRQEDIFTVMMQYSKIPGRRVALTQPAHILEADVDLVQEKWQAFIQRRKGQR